MTEDSEFLFDCTDHALRFAFQYSSQQSPSSPMLRAMVGPTGTGKGLSGLDGAGQAGMILDVVNRMSREERDVITARFGQVTHECPCCHQQTSTQDWRSAVSNLSMCDELHDLARDVRIAIVQKVLCRRAVEVAGLGSQYGMNERTLRNRIKKFRDRIFKVERRALCQLDSFFAATGLIPPQV
ncbi:hypothetical protein [Limnobacter litoralis]|nr:hypothetical protein [Limnobacter litoralis]